MNKGYAYLKGFRNGSCVLHVFDDDCLYVKKVVRTNMQVEWICYQSVLIKTAKNQPKCTARVIIHADGTLTRNKICHSQHSDHSVIRQDMKSLNEMKNHCDHIRTKLDGVAHKISSQDIFLQEMKK